MSLQLLLSAAVTGTLYALLALSLNLIYGTMRLLNVAHGEIVMVGAFTGYFVVASGAPPWLGMPAGFILTAALGVLLYELMFSRVLRTSRDTETIESTSLLVFFGISVILQNGATLLFGGTPRSTAAFQHIIHAGPVAIAASRLVALGASSAAVVLLLLFFRTTAWGLACRALIQSRDAAAIVGVDIQRAFRISSALGFGLAGLAGTIIGTSQPVTPFMGVQYVMVSFVIIILGGLGNLAGSVAGGLSIGVIETFGTALLGPSSRDLLIYGLFILVLMIRPQGLFNRRQAA